jgi:hypothetical protein
MGPVREKQHQSGVGGRQRVVGDHQHGLDEGSEGITQQR